MNNSISKFWDKIEYADHVDDECWYWTAYKTKKGYGTFCVNYKILRAHRFSYLIHKGEIPEGFVLDHLCRNTSCVNPQHLEVVTHKENVQRGISFNGSKTHCPQGHEYTEENTLKRQDHPNYRDCRTCNREGNLKRRINGKMKTPREGLE